MAESELAHDEQALFKAFVGGDGPRVRRHDLGNSGGARRTSNGNNPIHDVALGKNSCKISITQHGHRTHIVLHHVARRFQHRLRGLHGIESAVFYRLAESAHRTPSTKGNSEWQPRQYAAGPGGQYSITAVYAGSAERLSQLGRSL